jgi:sterol 14-demethylase
MALFNLAVGGLLVLACVGYYLFHKPPFHPKAPPLVTDATPLIGSISFFQERWFFWQRATSRSNTGNFTFWAGQHPVVGMSGAEGRKIFLDDKRLNFAEGYGALLAGSVTPSKDGTNEGENKFAAYITRRLTELLRGPHLQTCLPHLLSDTRTRFDELVADPSGMMNPFESIYGLVFHLTMRTVASNEIADDRASLARCLKLFEELDKSSTAVQVMYPWLPLPSKLKRLYAGGQLYMCR